MRDGFDLFWKVDASLVHKWVNIKMEKDLHCVKGRQKWCSFA